MLVGNAERVPERHNLHKTRLKTSDDVKQAWFWCEKYRLKTAWTEFYDHLKPNDREQDLILTPETFYRCFSSTDVCWRQMFTSGLFAVSPVTCCCLFQSGWMFGPFVLLTDDDASELCFWLNIKLKIWNPALTHLVPFSLFDFTHFGFSISLISWADKMRAGEEAILRKDLHQLWAEAKWTPTGNKRH